MDTTDLVPWTVTNNHRWSYPLMMLRLEQRRRRGEEVQPAMADRLERWLLERELDGTVVDYDPADPDGFRYVPRARGEAGLVRVPRPS